MEAQYNIHACEVACLPWSCLILTFSSAWEDKQKAVCENENKKHLFF